jgi:hypothetical protein
MIARRKRITQRRRGARLTLADIDDNRATGGKPTRRRNHMRRLLLILSALLVPIAAAANSPPSPWRDPPIIFQSDARQPISAQPNAGRITTTNPTVDFDVSPITVTDRGSLNPGKPGRPQSLGQPLVGLAQPRSDAGRISPTHTVIAGVAMSAAIIVAGLTFARRKRARTSR